MKQTFRKTYSVSLFWNKRDIDPKTKVALISLTINLPKQQFRLSLKLKATKADFDLSQSSARKLPDSVRELKQTLNDYVLKAETVLDRLKDPSKESFTRMFRSETDLFLSNKTDVLFFYQLKMDEALNEERVGSTRWFKQCKSCLAIYSPKVCFEDIDEKWLKEYHQYLKRRGNSESTCSMKLRCLRLIFNVARDKGFISADFNPFKNYKLSSSGKSKSVLYPAQVKSLYDYVPNGIIETRAKAYFMFCYLRNGMNFKDMSLLKFKDLTESSLTFIREKTKHTTKSGVKEIRVYLHDDMKRIIKEYGNKSKKPDDYVFPILVKGSDVVKQDKDRIRHKRTVNKKLAVIGKKLEFDVHLCLNLARHSFATALMLNGTPVSFISQAMGHSNSITTEHYLKSIPAENLKTMSSQLLSFA